MRKIKLTIWAMLLVAGLASCSEEDANLVTESGELHLSVQQEGSIQIQSGTKATVEGVNTDNYAIVITNSENAEVFNDVFSNLTSPLELPIGDYTVAANSNDLQEAAFNAPYYAGSEDFTIEADQATSTTVNCGVANVLVSVLYSDDVKGKHDVTTTVSNGNGELSYGKDETQVGYFKASSTLQVTVSLTRNEGDTPEEKTITIESVAAGQHHTINVDVASGSGNGTFGIQVDDQVTVVNTDILIEEDGSGDDPTPTPTNLVAGGDFEDLAVDFAFPSAADETTKFFGGNSKVVADAHEGGKAAELGAGEGSTSLKQQITVEAGKTYELSFYAKMKDTDDSAPQIPRVVATVGGTGVFNYGGVTDEDRVNIDNVEVYTKQTLEMIIPADATTTTLVLAFWLNKDTPGTFYVDNLSIVEK